MEKQRTGRYRNGKARYESVCKDKMANAWTRFLSTAEQYRSNAAALHVKNPSSQAHYRDKRRRFDFFLNWPGVTGSFLPGSRIMACPPPFRFF